MKKSRRTYNGVHLNKKSNTQDVVEQSLTVYSNFIIFVFRKGYLTVWHSKLLKFTWLITRYHYFLNSLLKACYSVS